jgi:hypothetical protein
LVPRGDVEYVGAIERKLDLLPTSNSKCRRPEGGFGVFEHQN